MCVVAAAHVATTAALVLQTTRYGYARKRHRCAAAPILRQPMRALKASVR
jgi:hypothetical protein